MFSHSAVAWPRAGGLSEVVLFYGGSQFQSSGTKSFSTGWTVRRAGPAWLCCVLPIIPRVFLAVQFDPTTESFTALTFTSSVAPAASKHCFVR